MEIKITVPYSLSQKINCSSYYYFVFQNMNLKKKNFIKEIWAVRRLWRSPSFHNFNPIPIIIFNLSWLFSYKMIWRYKDFTLKVKFTYRIMSFLTRSFEWIRKKVKVV